MHILFIAFWKVNSEADANELFCVSMQAILRVGMTDSTTVNENFFIEWYFIATGE